MSTGWHVHDWGSAHRDDEPCTAGPSHPVLVLDPADPALRERIARALAEHSSTGFDLGTPRKYTGHGGWNIVCQCDALYGSEADLEARWAPHLADAVLAALTEPEETP